MGIRWLAATNGQIPPRWVFTGRIVSFVLVSVWLTGCGGGSNSLSGGSVPTGGDTLTGSITLPDGAAVPAATVTACQLSTGDPITVTANASAGSFTVKNVPTTDDIELTFVNNGNTFRVIVSQWQLTNSTTVAVGDVTALTTVVAACIDQEVSAGFDQSSSIVATQISTLMYQVTKRDESQQQQQLDLTNPSDLQHDANATMGASANAMLAALASSPSTQTARPALDAILAYIVASGGTVTRPARQETSALVAEQAAITILTPAQVSSDFAAAGVTVNAAQVSTADQQQQEDLPSWTLFGGITPYEALVIAANPTSTGGFQLNSKQLSAFIAALTQ